MSEQQSNLISKPFSCAILRANGDANTRPLEFIGELTTEAAEAGAGTGTAGVGVGAAAEAGGTATAGESEPAAKLAKAATKAAA